MQIDTLVQMKLHKGAKLFEERIDQRVVEVADPLIEMSVEMLAILETLPV